MFCKRLQFLLCVYDFPLQGSPAFDLLPGICCAPFLLVPLFVSLTGLAGLCIGYSDLLHSVNVVGAGGCKLFSICQCFKLVLFS